ncbi:MAG: phospholipase D-like domain-containing protein [Myxococcota bacterium]|nr:phospholipase D-like domain-containing protein [Myxococcota bacterium]
MRRFATVIGILTAVLGSVPACVSDQVEDGADDGFPSGKADGGFDEGSPEALGVLSLVNDPSIAALELRSAAGITSRVATNIVTRRDGADGVPGTADDNNFDTLAELDAVPYVGPATLNALVECARDRGLVRGAAKIEVVFSPQPAAQSHNARIAQMIRDARFTVDIAMYSYSDAGINAAIADAVTRGVKVRFLFDTAREDKNQVDPAVRAATKSGRLEAMGVDVRYVNKILHHKFALVDGPRDDKARAATAKIVTGSANWSNSAATVFDENTLFIEGSAKLTASYQQEFDLLWKGSRDFVGPAPVQALSTANIDASQVPEEAGLAVLLTRLNFTPTGSDGTTWSANKDKLVVSDQFVAAINRAETSIHVGSGHLRLRPVAEALVARKQANPALDIKVYLDQQEFISASGDAFQRDRVETCIASATTPAAVRDCSYNNFLFSKALVDAGIDVRFKSYAYRWDHSYAPQMHSKYVIIDSKELLSGSYNLSMNAEHATFENALHASGPQFEPLLAAFEQNFTTMWNTSRAGTELAALREQIATASSIPLVFPSIALTYAEFDSLRALIRQHCPLADSTEYRSAPAAHRFCPRS